MLYPKKQPAPEPEPDSAPEVLDGEDARIYQMCVDRLVALGCPEPEAHCLAEAPVSWHDAADLVGRGCSWSTAVRILL